METHLAAMQASKETLWHCYEHFDALVEALRGLLPMNEEGNCKLCAEGIERDADMDHWDTGYLDNRCLDHHMFSQARAALDKAKEA